MADEKLEAKDYNEAISLVLEGKELIGDKDGFEEFLKKAYTQNYSKKMDGFYLEKDYVSVVKTYEEAKNNSYATISAEMTSKYTSSKTTYVNNAIDDAEKVFSENSNYTKTLELLQSAQREIGKDEDLQGKIEYYKGYIPAPLTDMDYYSKGKYVKIYADLYNTDVIGNKYSGDIIFSDSYYSNIPQSYEIEYFLNEKYGIFTGTLYLPYEARGEDRPKVESAFEVYGMVLGIIIIQWFVQRI